MTSTNKNFNGNVSINNEYKCIICMNKFRANQIRTMMMSNVNVQFCVEHHTKENKQRVKNYFMGIDEGCNHYEADKNKLNIPIERLIPH